MRILHYVVLAWIALALETGNQSSAADAPRRPNLIVIVVDDLGATDLGCDGSRFHRTPHIDRMAAQGLRAAQAYACSPVSSPTRAGLMTGRHPARLRLTDSLPSRPDQPVQKMGQLLIRSNLPPDAVPLPRALKRVGYTTAHIGKWHLGGEGHGPEDAGFDVNIGSDETNTAPSYLAPYQSGTNFLPGLEHFESGEYLTDRLTEEAERFIGQNRKQPFFLHLAHYAMHTPLKAKTSLLEPYLKGPSKDDPQTNAVYAAMLESVDESVRRILKHLDELGLSDNTLVLLTSDNGGLSSVEGTNAPSTSNDPLRAGKGALYEGGIRVPFIVRWPGVIVSRVVTDTLINTLDIYPTLLELAGVPLPAGPCDGVSLVPLLQGTGDIASSPFYWHYPHYSQTVGKPGGAIREGTWKLIEFYESGYLELYDLSEDPAERRNVATQASQRANSLASKLAQWRWTVSAQMMSPSEAYQPAPLQPEADGSLILPAHEVTIHGTTVRYEPPAHKDTIGYWTRMEDWVSWDFTPRISGDYAVEVLQGCGKGSGGSEVEVSVGSQVLRFTVEDTGHFQKFVAREIGEFKLEAGERYSLAVRPKTKPGVAVMDLRAVALRPRGAR